VVDYDAFLKTIEKSPVFTSLEQRKPGISPPAKVLRFYWLHKEGTKGSLKNAPGILFLKRDSLVAQCSSAKRAETLRAILEKMFGSAIAYRTTVHKSVEKRTETAASAGSSEPLEGGVIVRETISRQFDNWIDEKIPSIGNITPREAVKTPDGKRRLIDLLKEFENQNEHAMRRGLKSPDAIFFPVEKIRKELGL
jgi:hypothetical protein